MRRTALVLVAFLALAGLVGYLATSSNRSGGGDAGSASQTADEAATTGATGATGATAGYEEGAPVAAEGGGEVSVSSLPGLPELGSAVVRNARLTIVVRDGTFAAAFDAASLVAGTYGGYVQSSSTAGTRVRSGELLLRVPADRFDDAMSDLRGLGTVGPQSVSGEDVSAQFVDLEARLRTWEAQEVVLLDLMGQARTISDTIRVQGELQDVQLRIEQITGQLRLLEDRTTFATIQVSMREAGAPVAREDDETRPSLGEAWERAVDGFLGVCFAIVVGLGYLIPLAAIAGIGWLAFRRLSAPRVATPPGS
jgi:hypothetical protein